MHRSCLSDTTVISESLIGNMRFFLIIRMIFSVVLSVVLSVVVSVVVSVATKLSSLFLYTFNLYYHCRYQVFIGHFIRYRHFIGTSNAIIGILSAPLAIINCFIVNLSTFWSLSDIFLKKHCFVEHSSCHRTLYRTYYSLIF